MRAEDFDVNKLSEGLQGTCGTIQGQLDFLWPEMDEDDMTTDDIEALDQLIFLCATCGWFWEICDNAETEDGSEMICQECNEE